MGYEFRVLETEFNIRKENFEETISRIKKCDLQRNPENKYPGGIACNLAKTTQEKIVEAFKDWGWDVDFDEQGNIDYIEFVGINLHEEDLLFSGIANTVENNSFISAIGEDNKIWKWLFDDGECIKKTGQIVYE